VAIEFTVQGTVPPIVGDVTLVRHALLNVVLDALTATSSSKHQNAAVSVTVGQSSDCAKVTVRHFGLLPGGAKVDGSGLAVARSVVDAHGASIAIEASADGAVDVVTRWPSRLPIHPQS
jgi:nitrogen-specific signal transduction histidine kinase